MVDNVFQWREDEMPFKKISIFILIIIFCACFISFADEKAPLPLEKAEIEKQIEKMKLESENNRKNGTAFLEVNRQKEGVITLSSGLQYKILVDGKGPHPKPTDTVECHYKGTLIDETVFDSSYDRGEPAKFQVNQVIQGWVEALEIMKTGSIWMLYVPTDLAYGDRGAGDVIKPGTTLVFKIELLRIMD